MSEFKTNKISPRKGTTQTIGDSGDTLSIASGVTVTNAGTISTAGISGGTINNSGGTISGLAGVVEWDTTAKTTAFTAVSNKGYFCNTTSAAFTVTLPASPTAGDVISLKDYANTFDTNNLTLNPNGNKIQGSTENFIISVEGANSQFIYVDATRGWVLTDASKASDIAEDIRFVTATGGTVTCCGDYKIHTFTSPGTFCVSCEGTSAGSNTVDYLVIAGGGGGGAWAGGGGAGGFRTNYPSGCAGITLTVQGYPITVGAGGSGSTGICTGGSSGSNSIFSTIISSGGGLGSSYGCGPSDDGGSGGGNGGSGNTPPVSPPQGNPGGARGGFPNYGGGGGGGSGATGGNGNPNQGGNGGNGLANSITGSSVTRGGGGGGSIGFQCSSGPSLPGGTGGTGGGGNAANLGGGTSQPGFSGTTNTGGGGGSSYYGGAPAATGGSGGSGIVIIRYKYQ